MKEETYYGEMKEETQAVMEAQKSIDLLSVS